MKNIYKSYFLLFFLLFSISLNSFAFTKKKEKNTKPLFQLGAAAIYSSIDLSMYNNSINYRGIHYRFVTTPTNIFSLSLEYSTFPIHNTTPVWENIHTRKFDINGHLSFTTNNELTHIFLLAGINRHEWSGTRTIYRDPYQLNTVTASGDVFRVNRYCANIGCGFTQVLYENIGLFGDFRLVLGKSLTFEKVRVYDAVTTIGINISIAQPKLTKGNRRKTFGIGKKLYKWTEKGSK